MPIVIALIAWFLAASLLGNWFLLATLIAILIYVFWDFGDEIRLWWKRMWSGDR